MRSMADLVAVTRKKREEMEGKIEQLQIENDLMKQQLVDFQLVLERDMMLLNPQLAAECRQKFATELEDLVSGMSLKSKEEVEMMGQQQLRKSNKHKGLEVACSMSYLES